jgi:hypothetical protein
MQAHPSSAASDLVRTLLDHAVVRPARPHARQLEALRVVARAERALDDLDEAEARSQLRTAIRLDPHCERARALLDGLRYSAPPRA